MKIRFVLFLLLFTSVARAQFVTGIETKWNDEFTEWKIFTDDEEVEGEIIMRWQLQLDWTQWDYTIGDESGSIKLKWNNDPNQWEISGGNELITARTVWKDDPTEWRITNNTQTITLKSRWSNNFNEWRLKNGKYGEFDIFTEWEGDPRVWGVEEDLDEEISIHMKIALLFIATFTSTPKGLTFRSDNITLLETKEDVLSFINDRTSLGFRQLAQESELRDL